MISGLGIKNKEWSDQLIEDIKWEVQQDVQDKFIESDPKASLLRAMTIIRDMEEDTRSTTQLRRFVYIMATLIHHLKYGGLTSGKINNAVKLGEKILQINGIFPRRSRYAYLYTDLLTILSQIQRKEGLSRLSTWNQLFAQFSTKKDKAGQEGFHQLAKANRLLRQGHGLMALNDFAGIKTESLTPYHQGLLVLSKSKCQRLAGRLVDAKQTIETGLANQNLPGSCHHELLWEGQMLDFANSGDPHVLLASTRYKRPFHQASYLIEANLITKCLATTKWIDSCTKIRSLLKRSNFNIQKQGAFYQCAHQIENSYDFEIPLYFRLKGLGSCLGLLSKLTTVDKELLFLCAGARFLARVKAFDFAAYLLSEYASLSLRLSGGGQEDALALAHDMFQRDWYLDRKVLSIQTKDDALPDAC
jgi:hypothetical protein